MRFRPCIDIHNGCVKQIVGGSLRDSGSFAEENFVSEQDAGFYGRLYRSKGLTGGHIILLNPAGSPEYEADCRQAALALKEFPSGLQIGGGICPENAERFLDMGASQVIVTSYVFKGGRFDRDALRRMVKAVGREKLVLDLSCRRQGDKYYIVTDRWQKFTEVELDEKALDRLSKSCAEFLIHAVDVEGKASGIEAAVAKLMKDSPVPATYAGGISSFDDIEELRSLGGGKVDFTVGSALDIFGGSLPFDKIAGYTEG